MARRRRGAFCADEIDEYLKLAIDNEHKISPFYDGLKSSKEEKINFKDFEFTEKNNNKEIVDDIEENIPTEQISKLLVIDTCRNLRKLTQAFCQASNQERDLNSLKMEDNEYITDFYQKDVPSSGKLHLWLQNYSIEKYQSLKDIYLQNFEQFLIVETRRTQKSTNAIIEKILKNNKNVKIIFKLKVSSIPNQPQAGLRKQLIVQNIYCTSLYDGLSQMQSMIQI